MAGILIHILTCNWTIIEVDSYKKRNIEVDSYIRQTGGDVIFEPFMVSVGAEFYLKLRME